MAVTSDIISIRPLDMENCGLKKGSLAGEVAVVTGGARNIGLGYARAIAWAGGKVVVADIMDDAGKETERVINEENAPDTALFVKTDISNAGDVKNLARRAFDKFGKVDILINNAMNMRLNGPVLTSPVEELEQSYAISARGVMLAIQEFVPGMVKRKHGTVTYSSTQFHYSPPLVGGAIYTAGKAAATSLIMSLANEVKGSGVNVFCLAPTGIMSPRLDMPMPPPPKNPDGTPAPRGGFGFDGPVPPEAGGAAMVYCLLNAEKLNGSGVILFDVFNAMDFPYPNPETKPGASQFKRLNDNELTMALCYMGAGFDG